MYASEYMCDVVSCCYECVSCFAEKQGWKTYPQLAYQILQQEVSPFSDLDAVKAHMHVQHLGPKSKKI